MGETLAVVERVTRLEEEAERNRAFRAEVSRQLGLPADLEQAVPLADLPIAGQRSTRLAHEPDGRPLDGLPPSRSDQQRLHYNCAASWSSSRRKIKAATASAMKPTTNT